MHQIDDETTLDALFEEPRALLLKHSTVCPVSAYAWREVVSFDAAHPDIAVGWVDVRAHRPLAQAVASRTGVDHESPQAFLLEKGEVVWHDSHYGVREKDLNEAVESAAG